jgi:RNA polymerase sigma-70 factor, ECF subfamily
MISTTEHSSSAAASPVRTPVDRAVRNPTATSDALHDAELVRRFKSGDESAFVEIMARHRERISSIAFAMLKNHADADEIVQDTFLRAHRGLANFRGDSSLATWLHRIAMNLSRNRYWYFFSRRRHLTISLENSVGSDSQSAFSDLIASDAADPAREATTAEFTELVASCMGSLGAKSRKILMLRNTQDHSYGEIAAELGVNIGTVKSRIARARKNLRALMSERCHEFSKDSGPTTWFGSVRQARSEIALA